VLEQGQDGVMVALDPPTVKCVPLEKGDPPCAPRATSAFASAIERAQIDVIDHERDRIDAGALRATDHVGVCWVNPAEPGRYKLAVYVNRIDNNPLGCGNLGASLVSDGCGPKDLARGRPLVEAACRDHAYACGTLGVVMDDDKDPVAALAAFRRGCDADDSYACARLGVAVKDGRGTAANEAEALTHFVRSCARGAPRAASSVSSSPRSSSTPSSLSCARVPAPWAWATAAEPPLAG
jgi:hypothetical protein